ncbi:uncharacterized protein LOC143450435 [Clavelina lepadiformis]|uniref:uncharacterized protein LOC143450435 n=1 Tax=Clavelina lepadiformis TaxID=159417 RepID=UPI004041629B
MCFGKLNRWSYSTPCGVLQGSKIVTFIKTLIRIIKSIISRCLYFLYTFIAVWRVTEALDQSIYWLLLLTLCPLVIETLHAIIVRQGNEMKWISPSVFFYMVAGIPCMWLLELKLLDHRISNTTDTPSNDTQFQGLAISINFSDEGWTLALEQILIFVLVFAKWIAPKGELSRNELSQLLLVNIAAGADIIELLEVFGEDEVNQNTEIVYLVLAIWSWSLLQFAFVLTATKNLPPLDEDYDEVVIGGTRINTLKQEDKNSKQDKQKNGNSLQVPNHQSNGKQQTGKEQSTNKTKKKNGHAKESSDKEEIPKKTVNSQSIVTIIKPSETCDSEETDSKKHEDIEVGDETHIVSKITDPNKIHDQLRADEELAACLSGRRCFECFCCYTEIWGMLMSIIFQDGPFFILRMVILFHYKVVTHMNIFFTCKNVLVIILLFNRIRVVILEERKPWKAYMKEVKKQRRREKDETRRKLGLPPKTKDLSGDAEGTRRRKSTSLLPSSAKTSSRPGSAQPISKPRWMIWRA